MYENLKEVLVIFTIGNTQDHALIFNKAQWAHYLFPWKTQCFRMGSCPISHRKSHPKQSLYPMSPATVFVVVYQYDSQKKIEKKKSWRKNPRLSLIPLNTRIVLLLIKIMSPNPAASFFFFTRLMLESAHTRYLAFLSCLNWQATHLNPALNDIHKKTIMTNTKCKQTKNRPHCYHCEQFCFATLV